MIFVRRYFERQFAIAEETKLPMFLHNRNSTADFVDIVKRNRHKFRDGVVSMDHIFSVLQYATSLELLALVLNAVLLILTHLSHIHEEI